MDNIILALLINNMLSTFLYLKLNFFKKIYMYNNKF